MHQRRYYYLDYHGDEEERRGRKYSVLHHLHGDANHDGHHYLGRRRGDGADERPLINE